MAISSSSKFKVFYCSTGLPTQEDKINVGGLYVYNDAIYLCKDYADSKATWEKLDGLPQGAENPASGVAGEYFFNTGDKVLYYWDGTAWTGAQAKALSQQVSFTITDGAQENPVTIATGSMAAGSTQATLTVSGVPAAKITAGALANGMTATTQTAGDNTTKIATTAFVKTALDNAAVNVMHYKGTVATPSALPNASADPAPIVGDVYNISADGSNWAYSSATNYTPSATAGNDYLPIKNAQQEIVGYWEKLGSTLDTSNFALRTGDNDFDGTNTFTGNVTLIGTDSDLTVGGELGVTGASTLGTVQAGATTVGTSGTNANLTVNGNASVTGTLDVDGAATLASATIEGGATVGTTLGVTGNTTVGGTLGVTQATTLSSTLSVGSTSALAGNVTIGATGAGNGADLTVNGAITATGDISGDDITGATIGTTGDATIGGDANVTGDISGASLSVTGDVGSATLTISGNGTVGGTLGVTNKTTLAAVDVNGDADFNDDVSIDGGTSGENNGKTFTVGQFVSSSFAGPVAFSGTTTAVTPAANDDSTKVATTAWVNDAVDAAITAGLTWTVLS